MIKQQRNIQCALDCMLLIYKYVNFHTLVPANLNAMQPGDPLQKLQAATECGEDRSWEIELECTRK